ncbi:MAG: DEAD/DEAH box helicase [Verrucomicrobia bacterium]|nr:DEAD/DEAH box helicase [Verrucomicrobiota bacterium]
MAQKGLFKTEFEDGGCPANPELLFHDLKARAEEIRHLWSHQADLLRAYTKEHLHTPDIALELPTGAGKTLVALLIAEFRRRKFDDRVAYLCPTRQLANQVGGQAKRYGIKAHVLVGKQRDYNAEEFDDYQRGSAIAVTTYSGLFNTNPRIKDPSTIVLDDAHSSENYISSMWSVELTRKDHDVLFKAIVDIFAPLLPASFATRLRSEEPPALWTRDIDMVPGKHLRDRLRALRDLITTHLPADDDASYSWQMIADHLPACNLFINWGAILLRPIIPPAQTHAPFASAKQRVYMSATLGAGGELERITGVRQIQRLPIPAGWDKRGSGRRLFLMPELSCDETEALQTAVDSVQSVKRALTLVPNEAVRRTTVTMFEESGVRVLGREHIEDSLDSFTKSENTVLVLANRYDGIDLPDESCRLLIRMGLPVGTNLQESFLLTRLAASSLLRDRMLTRFTQGVGRCTRSDRDYSAVLLLDRNLIDFVLRSENRKILHPELQAELQFGMENSDGKSRPDFVALLEALIEQGEDWSHAERAILNLRSKKTKEEDQVAKRLKNVAADEVDFVYALWTGNLEKALEKSRSVSDNLGGNETKGYRGWWYYLAADVATQGHESNKAASSLQIAKDYYAKAANCSLSISWFAELARLTIAGSPIADADELTPLAVETTRRHLIELGLTGQRFDQQMKLLLEEIMSKDHDTFQRGLKSLGDLLGFDSDAPDSTADPDCVWSIGDKLHIAHEVKVEHSPGDEIGANDVRQAASHVNWVKAHRPCSADCEVVCIIESPRQTVEAGAIPHAGNLFHASPTMVKQLAEESVSVLRSVRASSPTMQDETMLEAIRQEMAKHGLLPRDIIQKFARQLVSKMPVQPRKKT